MSISREVLAKYIRPGDVFVETGTKWGDTVIRAAELGARVIYTCELDRLQYAMAANHVDDALARAGVTVHIENCDSETFLQYKAPFGDVVFLDAHTEKSSPVMSELRIITNWHRKPRVIIVDDIRLMETCWGIPLESIRSSLKGAGYAIRFEEGAVWDDILVAERP